MTAENAIDLAPGGTGGAVDTDDEGPLCCYATRRTRPTSAAGAATSRSARNAPSRARSGSAAASAGWSRARRCPRSAPAAAGPRDRDRVRRRGGPRVPRRAGRLLLDLFIAFFAGAIIAEGFVRFAGLKRGPLSRAMLYGGLAAGFAIGATFQIVQSLSLPVPEEYALPIEYCLQMMQPYIAIGLGAAIAGAYSRVRWF